MSCLKRCCTLARRAFADNSGSLAGRLFQVKDDTHYRTLERLYRSVTFTNFIRVEPGHDKARESVANLQGHHVRQEQKTRHAGRAIILDLDVPADRSRTDGEDIARFRGVPAIRFAPHALH